MCSASATTSGAMTNKQTNRRRRPSVCQLHPSAKPTTGFCAACLRERLASIEGQSPSPSSSASAAFALQLRRTRSYSARDASTAVFEQPRRRSCDVRSSSSSLHHLFAVDDEERDGNRTRLLRVPDLKEEEEEGNDEEEEFEGFDERKEMKVVNDDSDDEGGEYKTMKEFIDLEWRKHSKKNNGRDLKEIASVLCKKLRKLSLKHQKNKSNEENLDSRIAIDGEIHTTARSEIDECGRRSCDIIDARVSLEAGRTSFEEARASWDGCLVGKTYPRLTPLDSVTEDAKAYPENNAGDKDDEEEKNPGSSAQTKEYYSDSRRRRSFDRSSSFQRQGSLEVDGLKAISNTKVSPETVGLFHGAKLLVTEKELRDSNWYSIKNYKPEGPEYGSKGIDCAAGEVKQDGFGSKKPPRKWHKNWSIWGLMQRKIQTKNHEVKAEKSLKLEGNVIEGSLAESLLKLRRVAKGETNGDVSQKLIRSYSVSARKSCDGVYHGAAINGSEGGRSSCDGLFHGSVTGIEAGRSSCDGFFHGIEAKAYGEKSKESHLLQRNKTTNTNTGMHSPNNLENGLLRFYLTPVRSHRMTKSGKSRLMNSSSTMGSAL